MPQPMTQGIQFALDVASFSADMAVQTWAEYVLSQAVDQVPIEEAVLQNSGVTAVDEETHTGYVGFGAGAAAAYAVKQHEVPQRHDPGRKDHYLSDPVAASEQVAEQIIGRVVRQQFR